MGSILVRGIGVVILVFLLITLPSIVNSAWHIVKLLVEYEHILDNRTWIAIATFSPVAFIAFADMFWRFLKISWKMIFEPIEDETTTD